MHFFFLNLILFENRIFELLKLLHRVGHTQK